MRMINNKKQILEEKMWQKIYVTKKMKCLFSFPSELDAKNDGKEIKQIWIKESE